MKYVLDTNICIFLINRTHPKVAKALLRRRAEDVSISVITAAELRFGAEKSARREVALSKLDLLLSTLNAVPFDLPAVAAYGQVRADLSKRGTPIGPLDTLIAAHALSLGAVLVTNNTREFKRVRGLPIEDWTA